MTPRERAEVIGEDLEIVGIGSIRRSYLKGLIEQAITAAVEAEREACAKLAETTARPALPSWIAEAIRARSTASTHSTAPAEK